MPVGRGDDPAPPQRAPRRPGLRRELRISEDGRPPGLLAPRREQRVIEERHIASRDHAQRDPHREVVEEERSEEHTSELQSPCNLVCRLLLEKKKINPSSR